MIKRLLVAIVVLFTTSTYSQNDTIKLNDVSITSQRFKLEAVSSKTIQMDSVKTYFSQETPYFFSKTPSIVSQSDNGTPFGYSYFTLRGMGQNRINYTLNGVPLNDGEDLAVYTSNYTDLLNSLKSVQIIRGSGVSANGASSYVGLVNMDLTSPFSNNSHEFSSMLGSFDSHKNSFKYNTGVTKKGFGATFRLSETYTNGFRNFSSGQSYSLSTSLGYQNEVTSIRFNVVYGSTKNGQSWLAVPEGMPVTTNILTTSFGISPQYDNFKSGIYQLQIAGKFSEQTIFSLSTYHSTVNGNYDMPAYSVPSAVYSPVIDINKNLKLESSNWGGYYNVKHTSYGLTIQPGFTINTYTRKHIGTYNSDTSLNYANFGEKFEATAFTKVSYKIGLDWILEGDYQLRNTQFSYKSDEYGTELYEYNFHNYSFGLSFQRNEVFKPYISFSKSSREPSRTNILGNYDHLSNTPNYISSQNVTDIANIKPETVYDLELGTKIKYKYLTGSLNIYSMYFNNEIISVGQLNSMGIALGTNANKSNRLGLEGDLILRIKKLEVGSTFNLSKNKVWLDDVNSVPVLTPNFTSNLYTNYTINKVSFGLNYKYVAQSFLDTDNLFICPEYHLVDASIGYKFKSKLSFNLVVNNLLNKNWTTGGNVGQDYETNPAPDGHWIPKGDPYRQFYYTAGTNVYATLNYKF
jgi:iron complex outermembrane receptor protein